MRKNLVTGGLGFLGAYLAKYLLQKNEEVVIFDVKSASPDIAADLKSKAEIVVGDVGSWVHVLEAVKKQIPGAQLTFDEDKSAKMQSLNRGVNYQMDNTAAFEDFAYQPVYLLNEMVADFINEVRQGS